MQPLSHVLSAQTYTVREFITTPADFAASMRKIRRIGYTAVELSGVRHMSTAEVKAILDEVGLTVSGSHYYFDDLQGNLDDIMAQCQAWRCENVCLTMMPESYAEAGEAGFRRFIVELSPIAQALFNNGFKLSYHNHNYELAHFTGDDGRVRTGLDWIFSDIDPRHLHAQIDAYWIQAGGANPVTWIRKMAGRMPTLHLKDMAVEMWTPVFAEVGGGNLEWPAIVEAARAAGVRWYVVEQDFSRRDPFESLQMSYQYLQQFGLS